MRRLFLTAAAAALIPASAYAADTIEAEVEAVVVTADRSERPRAETPAAITVVTREDLARRQIVVLSDALAQAPGVSINRNGGLGSATSVRIRGAESEQTVVLIDGVKLNDPASPGGAFDFGNLLTGDLARIEVLRGAQSVLWGSQAIGGVVNLLTERPRAGRSGVIAAELGSNQTGYVRGGMSFGSERAALRLGGGAFSTDGVSAFQGGAERDGFESVHATARLDVALTDALALDLRAYHADSRTEIDGYPAPAFSFADTAEFSEVQERLGYAGLNLDAGVLRHRLGVAATRVDRENRDPAFGVIFAAKGDVRRLEYQGTAERGPWRAVFGLEREQSEIDSGGLARDAELDSGYLQGSRRFRGGLSVTAGVRRDEHDRFGGRTTGQAGLAFTPDRGVTVWRANWAQGFKAPSLFQLYSDYGNAGLQAESAESVDLGVERRIGAVALSAVAFARETDNQVDFVGCFGSSDPRCIAQPFGFYDNVGRTRAHGLELAAEGDVGGVMLAAAYTWLDAENADTGRALVRRPEHTLFVSADRAVSEALSAGLTLHAVGERFDDALNTVPIAPYLTVDLRAAYTLTPAVELYGRIENLFDTAYEQTAGYGHLGRGAFAGVRARF